MLLPSITRKTLSVKRHVLKGAFEKPKAGLREADLSANLEILSPRTIACPSRHIRTPPSPTLIQANIMQASRECVRTEVKWQTQRLITLLRHVIGAHHHWTNRANWLIADNLASSVI
jgi:hypothetical protein